MNDTISARKALSLHGMTGVWREVLDKARIMTLDHEVVLHQLFKAEAAQRVVRFMVYQMRLAYFPSHRDLFEIDFTQFCGKEPLLRELHQLKFLDCAHNVVLIGVPLTGKMHQAGKRKT